ncbi:YncE family protein [Desulfitobacterium hafniense]|uniref:YncE family protein n=1 Tax=Desulfitobacterium hafniense TaxID=49338 RepID=UPI00037CF64B|nr:YncE family protein [Desulfitobacterium hafniense]
MTNSLLAWVSMPAIDSSLPGDIAVYHMESEKLLGMIPVGIGPGYLACFPEGKKLYVPNGGSDTLSVIDCDSFIAKRTIPVGKNPQALVIDSAGAKGYVAGLEEQVISVIDLHKDEVINTIPLNLYPSGLALSRDGKKLYVSHQAGCSISIIDTEHHQAVDILHLKDYPKNSPLTSLSPALSSPDLTLSPVSLALSPDDTLLYLIQSPENRISVIDLGLRREIASIPVGRNPQRIALHPERPLAYVTNHDSDSISIISTWEHQVLATISSLSAPLELTLTPEGSQLWVTNGCQLTLIDIETKAIISTLYAPLSAQIRQGVAISESHHQLLLSEVLPCNTQRPYSFVTEKIYFKPPKPFDLTIHHQFPIPTAIAEGLVFEEAEVKFHSISILPIPLRPNYHHLTFSLRIPYKIIYRDEQNQLHEQKDAIHHVLSAVETHLTPSRINQSLNLRIFTQSEVIGKSVPTPNSLDLMIRTQLVAMQQIHPTE